MTRRDAWLPPVLTIATCGIYYFYWQYVTTDELKRATGREDLNPTMDLLLSLLCCGMYSFYVQYRNMQVVHEQFTARGQRHEDRSTFVLLMHLVTFVNGVTAFVGMMIAQDELNKLEELLSSGAQPQMGAGMGGGFGGGPATF